jgi:uncharacterized membrane protein
MHDLERTRRKTMYMIAGPIQLVVLTFPSPDLLAELGILLRQLRTNGLVRMVDEVFVWKNEHADLLILEGSSLDHEEAEFRGILADTLFGDSSAKVAGTVVEASPTGTADFAISDDNLLEIADRIPVGSAALFLLLEHVWVNGLLAMTERSTGTMIANGWIDPAKLPTRPELDNVFDP